MKLQQASFNMDLTFQVGCRNIQEHGCWVVRRWIGLALLSCMVTGLTLLESVCAFQSDWNFCIPISRHWTFLCLFTLGKIFYFIFAILMSE